MARTRTTYANVMATLAFVIATSGGAYAATQLPKNSVGAKQVKDSSLTARDFKPGQLPTGVTGPAGPQGAEGPQGAPGPNSRSPSLSAAPAPAKAGPRCTARL